MTHICQKSRFQTTTFFCLIPGFYQFTLSFLKLRNIVINTDKLQLTGSIIHYITNNIYPCPLPSVPVTNTKFFTKTVYLIILQLYGIIKQCLTIFLMNMTINTNYLIQRCRVFFSQIIKPLSNSITCTGNHVKFTISYFPKPADQRKRRFKFRNTAISLIYLGIIDINK